MRAATRSLVAVVIAVPLLAGCSNDPDAGPTLPPLPPSATSTSEITPAAGPSPTDDAEAAAMRVGEQVAAAYFAQLDELAAGRPSSVEDTYSVGCGYCAQQVGRIRDLLADGAILEEHETVLDIRADMITGKIVNVRVNGNEAAARLLSADGQVLQEFPAVNFSYVMNVEVSDGTGRVIEMQAL